MGQGEVGGWTPAADKNWTEALQDFWQLQGRKTLKRHRASFLDLIYIFNHFND